MYKRTREKVKRILILLLVLCIPSFSFSTHSLADDPDIPIADGADPWEVIETTIGSANTRDNYFYQLSDLTELAENSTETLEYSAEDTLVEIEYGMDPEDDVSSETGVYTPGISTAVYELDIPEEGAWHIAFSYTVPDDRISELTVDLSINGSKLYPEMDEISLPVRWANKANEITLDRYGNETYPSSERVYDRFISTLNLDMFNLNEPLLFAFEAGLNTIEIVNNDLSYVLESIHLIPREERIDYVAYLDRTGATPTDDFVEHELIILEGEDSDQKSHPHIRGERTKDDYFSPYESTKTLINVLAPNMWELPGNLVEYQFEVETAGYYRLGLRYQQGTKQEVPVYKNIYIDGEIPFSELESYSFPFTSNNVRNHWLGDTEADYRFYLEPGIHTISLESTASHYYLPYEQLRLAIQEMNQLTLDIRMITGSRVDKNRDWNIELYIPDIRERITDIITVIDSVYDHLASLAGQSQVSAWNNLIIIADQMQIYLDKTDGLDRLVNNLDGFSQADGSLAQQISAIIDLMLQQPMSIDQIYVAGDDISDVPTSPGFFTSIKHSIEKLWSSFVDNQEADLSLDESSLNIWINRPATHIDVLREMINQSYPDNSVVINLSAMPDENRLLLSVLADEAPDGVLGVTTGKPYDFALRGAVHDLTKFEDFTDAVSDFTAEMFVPFAHDGGLYAFPETATFHVLFYRTDILEQMNLDVPQTWDDLIEIIPILDRHGMNIQTMIAATDAYKGFGTTVPFIQQFDGNIYSEDGLSAAFSDPNTIQAFELLTDLYSRYNLPYRIVNFYNNFKSGMTPIGVSEMNTYTLLKYAAPEINGQWAIAPNLGRINEAGEFINTQPNINSATMIMEQSEKKDEMWEFMKWWMDTEVQLQFGNELQMRFGREYIWNSANLSAVAQASYYDVEDREIIVEHIRTAQEVPRHPAYFQAERELSNAWNTVMFDGTSVREALDAAEIATNRMIYNKLLEFGYIDADGNILKEVQIADVDEIEKLGNFISGEKLPVSQD